MVGLADAVRKAFPELVTCRDTALVSERLRRVAADPEGLGGLGVALLVAWQQGLEVGHVPTVGESLRRLPPSEDCPYAFVHVPVRRFRSDHRELALRGILDPRPDPARLVFHEDALVGTFRVGDAAAHGLTEDDVLAVLGRLAAAGRLEPVAVGDPRVRLTARGRRPAGPAWLPVAGNGGGDPELAVPPVIARALATCRPCTYCSGAALNPREVTVTGAVPGTVRSYRWGFTFAPVGDPREVCHVLAWDDPAAADPPGPAPVLDMEPQPFSVTDLGALVRTVNADVERFRREHDVDDAPGPPFTGVCNHWAGNSIHHQHYQLLRLPELPILRATSAGLPWPARAHAVRAPGRGADGWDDVLTGAQQAADAWYDGGSDPDRTLNVVVTLDGDDPVAIVIPRRRSRVDTSTTTLAPGVTLRKGNAAVLELAGYFVIDDPAHFEALASLTPAARGALATSWLRELAADP